MMPPVQNPAQSDSSAALLLAAIGLGLLVGCQEAPKPTTARPPIEVTAVTVAPKDIPAEFEFVGKTESSRKVQIHARVEGFLDRRVYQEGTIVKTGAVLFVLDRKPFEARLAAAKAALAEQQARLQTAQANLKRVRPLAQENAVSQKDLDDAIGQTQAAAAAVEAAKADVINAELNLSYTTIRTPVTGLASFAVVQEGTYVNFQNSLLTYVSALSPMRVNFSVSENQILNFRDQVTAGTVRKPEQDNFEVEIVLADGTVFPERGRITFADAEFSETTGTYLIRAELPNKQGVLRPGQFVRIHVLGAMRPEAILLPKRAVMQGAQGSFVWVIASDNKAELRPVTTGQWYGDNWIITAGLKQGEVVAVDGAIKLQVDAPVKTVAMKDSNSGGTSSEEPTAPRPK